MLDIKLYLKKVISNIPNKVSKTEQDILQLSKTLIEQNKPVYMYDLAKRLNRRPQSLRFAVLQMIKNNIFTVEKIKKINLLIPTEKGLKLIGIDK
jgi:Mn-dependent DtxR family transcriptional regulator